MNRIILAIAVAPLALFAAETKPAHAAPATVAKPLAQGPESLGVTPPKIIPSIAEKLKGLPAGETLKTFAQSLDNKLTDALARTRKFKVVTRSDLDAVAAEQNLAASGNLDLDDPDLAKRFKLAGAGAILLVTVDDFQDRVEVAKFETSGETLTRRIIRVGATAKMLDTTTGVVRESVAIPPVTQDDLRPILAKLTRSNDRADAFAPELARVVADRIALRLVDVRFPARVMAKSADNVVTFNRGDGSGVAVGQEWGVYASGEELTDPDTGESLGHEETLVGRAVVTEVEAKFAKARIVKDQGVVKGAIIRLIPASAAPTPAAPESR